MCDLAPPSLAEGLGTCSAESSALCTTLFVRNRRWRGVPEGGSKAPRCCRNSERAGGALSTAVGWNISPSSVHCAELGLADADCVLEHGLEYGLQLARRA